MTKENPKQTFSHEPKEQETPCLMLLDWVEDSIHITDRNFRILFINRFFLGWLSKIGVDGNIIGKTFQEAFPFLPEKVFGEYETVLHTKLPLISEDSITVEGKTFSSKTRKIPIIEGNEVVRIMTIVHNITEQKMVDEALLESQERYHNLVNISPDPIIILQDSQFKFANQAFTDMFGYTREDMDAGLTYLDVVAQKDRQTAQSRYEGRIAGLKSPATYRVNVITKSGQAIPCESASAPITYKGQPADMAIIRNITERMEAAQAIRESERYNRMLFDNSPIGLGLTDMNGKLLDVNQALSQIVGYSIEEMLTLTYWELTPEKYAQDEQDQLESLRKTNRYGPYEKEYIHKDGHLVPVRLLGLIFEKDGKPCIWSSVEDITEQKQNKKKLAEYHDHLEDLVRERTDQIMKLEAEKSMMERLATHGRVAAGVAHEINNPIASIKSSFLLIKDLVPADHQYFHYVGRIDREIDRVGRIVKQMFQLYNPKAQEPQNIDLEFLFSDIPTMLAEVIQNAAVNIECSVQPNIPPLRLPDGNLRQILSNLLVNAIHASSRDGKILMAASWEEDPGALLIKVTDFGQGIPPEILSSIFDPFFTTKDSGPQGGIGLGLSVSQSLAKAMGGEITVQTEPGEGTIFQLFLPL